MTAELLADHADARVYHATHADLADVVVNVGGCDLLIVDAPYSERTHSGHNTGAQVGDRAAKYASGRYAVGEKALRSGKGTRRQLNYDCWSKGDVDAFVDLWSPLARGWFVSLTDHILYSAWEEALRRHDRIVFSPLACVEPGSRVRMPGDGPAQWSCWACVARPKGMSKWGALPGAYVVPPGFGERGDTLRERVVGAKPLWLMERLISHYSRPGDLIVDPCCGGGTSLLAAQRTGRRAIGGDAFRDHAELAAERIKRPAQAPLFASDAGADS